MTPKEIVGMLLYDGVEFDCAFNHTGGETCDMVHRVRCGGNQTKDILLSEIPFIMAFDKDTGVEITDPTPYVTKYYIPHVNDNYFARDNSKFIDLSTDEVVVINTDDFNIGRAVWEVNQENYDFLSHVYIGLKPPVKFVKCLLVRGDISSDFTAGGRYQLNGIGHRIKTIRYGLHMVSNDSGFAIFEDM